MARAGWSGGKFSASKLNHSLSSSGPSFTCQPMPTKMSAMRSSSMVSGWRAPARQRLGSAVTSTASATSRAAASCSWISASRAWNACVTRARDWPTSLPASLRSAGGSERSDPFSRASGDASPMWAQRAWASDAESVVAASAAIACSTAAPTVSSEIWGSDMRPESTDRVPPSRPAAGVPSAHDGPAAACATGPCRRRDPPGGAATRPATSPPRRSSPRAVRACGRDDARWSTRRG